MTCACGHVLDEHDRRGECQVHGCPCFAYEADPDADDGPDVATLARLTPELIRAADARLRRPYPPPPQDRIAWWLRGGRWRRYRLLSLLRSDARSDAR